MKQALVAFFLLSLAACVPAAVQYKFNNLGEIKAREMATTFIPQLKAIGVQLEDRGTAYQYQGSDERAFLAVADKFYLEHPGFCPLQDAFFIAPDQSLYMTVAAKDLEIAVFIYDQSQKPNLTFAFFNGKSTTKIPTVPCRTATR
jgi:hypothetical protein